MNLYKSNPTASEPGRISGLYLGEAFSGKTHNACTWPSPLVCSFDPDNMTARMMPGVWVLELESWSEFEGVVMPYVRNRALGKLVCERVPEMKDKEPPLIETLVVDTISVGATKLAQEMQGTRDKLAIQDYGTILNKLTATTLQCTDTTKARKPGEATYNVIFTSHLTTETDDNGAVIAVRPAIVGQFKGMIARMFGFCFLCEQLVSTSIVNGQAIKVEKRHVYTVPKSNAYVAGDKLGGKPPFKKLPITVGGTYPELVEAWGIKA